MGSLYVLSKEDKKEYFDLDKGNWIDIFGVRKNPFIIHSIYPTQYILFQKIQEKHPNWDMKYAMNLAGQLMTWCGDDRIWYDNRESFFDIHCDNGYKMTGER